MKIIVALSMMLVFMGILLYGSCYIIDGFVSKEWNPFKQYLDCEGKCIGVGFIFLGLLVCGGGFFFDLVMSWLS